MMKSKSLSQKQPVHSPPQRKPPPPLSLSDASMLLALIRFLYDKGEF